MTGKCANIGEKNEKKSSEQLSCTDVETLRAGIIVERLVTGHRPVQVLPPSPSYQTTLRSPSKYVLPCSWCVCAYTVNMLADI